MATTCKLIAKNVLGSDTATVTFSSIPGTYTDLWLVLSARSVYSVTSYDNVLMRFNSDSSSIYSWRSVYGLSGSAASESESSATGMQRLYANGANMTADTFSNSEAYIPNYAGSTNKSVSITSATESNSANNVLLLAAAGLWASTAAITSITLTTVSSSNFKSGSSFFLYGITKA